MDRVQRNQTGTINAYWERDGVALDPGAGTVVTVTNDSAGTVLVNAQPVTTHAEGQTTYTLPLSATTALDTLTCVWTAPDTSKLTTYCEVVGGFLFTVAQARALSPLQDTSMYPTAVLLYYRALAETALEDVCGVCFAPRYRRDVARVIGYGMLEVRRRKVTAVRAVYTQTDAGPVALPTLTGMRIELSGDIYVPNLWSWFSQPIQVCYESGYLEVPPRVSRASLLLARRWLIESPWDERMIAFKSREGGEIDIQTANGFMFDIPEVNAVAEAYGTPFIA